MKDARITAARFLPFGDTALTVEFGDAIDLETNRKVIALSDSLLRAKPRGVQELVPTYRSLLIRYNPQEIDYGKLVSITRSLSKLERTPTKERYSKAITVPVIYGGEYGPDIHSVAEFHGMTEEDVIVFHSTREYRVYMIGFLAGFPYLGEVADEIATPRLETPRLKVPAGSVGMAEKQTGVYPCDAPGGWQIIGRTPLKLFDPQKQPPALLRPGDTVKFQRISETQYQELCREERSK